MMQRLGHIAFLKPHWNDEDLMISKQFCFFECDLQFFMAVALLLVEASRKTDDDHITFEDRLADLVLPVLSRLEFFRIQPDIDSIFDEARIKFMNNFPVTMGVNQKYVDMLC